jgi:hypothetical protein
MNPGVPAPDGVDKAPERFHGLLFADAMYEEDGLSLDHVHLLLTARRTLNDARMCTTDTTAALEPGRRNPL